MERMAELDSICGSFEEPEQSEPNFETIELRNHHLTPTSLFLWCLVILSASGLVQPESHRILRSVHCFVLLLCCTFRYTVAGTLMPSPLLARRVRVRQAPQLAPPPPRSMAASCGAAEPAAKKARMEPYVWLQVKGAGRPIQIHTTGLANVNDLLEQVKKKKPTQLKDVDADLLSLYRSVEAHSTGGKAMRPGLPLTQLDGGTEDTNPLYVYYDMPAPAAAAPAAPAVRVVIAEDFDIISKCERPREGNKPTHFVQLYQCVAQCIKAVEENLPKETRSTNPRVPPVMLSRCMRGGKTTVLVNVFDSFFDVWCFFLMLFLLVLCFFCFSAFFYVF